MPRVRILQGVSGLDFAWAPGDIVDLDDEAAAQWADGERAVLVGDGQDEQPEGAPALEHLLPVVVGDDGQELEVVAAAIEETDPPEGQDQDRGWVRWSVTVRLPVTVQMDNTDATLTPADPVTGDGDPYDPSDHPVKDVLAYLEDVGEEEAVRVLQAEENADSPRKGIVGQREDVLARARARANDQARVEKAAEASRGGGRGTGIETR